MARDLSLDVRLIKGAVFPIAFRDASLELR